MQRINTAYFYRLAQKLLPLRALSPGTKLYFENYVALHSAQEELASFLGNPLMPPQTSYGTGKTLLTLLQKITSEAYEEDREIQRGEPVEIIEALSHFEIALQSDFGTRDTFIVSPKGAYSTTILAERGETSVTTLALSLAQNLAEDLHDGCRALAFELPTGAAFHFFRAIESMVLAYGHFVRKKPFSRGEKKRGLGGYAILLMEEPHDVDARITHAIAQIASLHRNPTMHPERHISMAEALSTFAMITSTIDVLAIDWNRRINTPDVPLLTVLPDDSAVTALLEDGASREPNDAGL